MLLVEDNAEVREVAGVVLANLGYQVVAANDGIAALALVDRGEAFDLLFSDAIMPGMSGIELAKEVRRRRPGMPMLLTSGFASPVAVRDEVKAEGIAFLAKPYRRVALAAKTGSRRRQDVSAAIRRDQSRRPSAAIASMPAWSSASKRDGIGASRSSTPITRPSRISGTTSSEREAASQAMWPGKACTSSTRMEWPRATAVPHTPCRRGCGCRRACPGTGRARVRRGKQEVEAGPVEVRHRRIEQRREVGGIGDRVALAGHRAPEARARARDRDRASRHPRRPWSGT